MNESVTLIWAVIATVASVALLVFVVRLSRRHDTEKRAMETLLNTKQTKATQLGQNQVRGELNQILGAFAMLNEYEQLAVLSSVSKQFSLDLIGIKDDSVDFIEVKSSGTPLSPNETKVKRLIEGRKVAYRVIEGNLPKTFQITNRS